MSKVIREFSSTIAVFILYMLAFGDLNAQQSVGIGTTAPNPNAILELKSDHQGILVPRLSTSQRVQMAQILQNTSSNDGMIVFDRDTGKFYYWFSSQWNEGLGSLTSSTVNGDLAGSLPNPHVTGIQGRPVASDAPTNNQVLKWDGTAWVPSRDIGIEYEAADGLEIVGNTIKIGDEAITQQKIAHDAVTTNKIANNAVTLEKIAPGGNSTFLSIDANGILQWEDKSRLVSSSLGTGKIFIGNNAETAQEQALYGDITIAFDGEATIVDNSIGSSQIIDGSIATIDLADGAITNEKIADEAVTENKLADQSVGLQKIKTTGQSNALLTINHDGEPVWFSPGNNRVIITTNDGQIFTEGRNAFATSALPEGNIFVGNSEGQAYPMSARTKGRILIGNGATLSSVAVTGDVNLNELGVTEIQDDAVTTTKIADDAVTSEKILDGAVQTEDLADASMTEAKIGENAVTTAKIADASITTDKLANSAVTTAKILDGTIQTGDLADGTVTSEKIADGTIANADLDKASISLSGFGAAADDLDLGSNRITHVADPTGAQDAATKHYVDGQVAAATDLEEGHVYVGGNTGKATAVDASAAGNVLVGDGTTLNPVAIAGDIALAADGNVTISNDAVTSEKILDGAVQAEDLADASVTEAKIGENAVTTAKIADASITTDKLANSAVTTGKILDGTIQTGDLADGTVTNQKIAANAVTSEKIADGTIANADLDKASIPLSGFGAAADDLDLGSNRITHVADPTGAQDAATKHYVDGQVAAATELEEGHVYVGGNTGKATAVDASAAGNVLVGDGTTLNPVAIAGDIALAADGNVTISNDAVTSEKILDGAVQAEDLADASVTEAKIGENAVTTAKIADASITTDKLANSAVTTGKIGDGAVTSAKILDGTIQTGDLADGTVTNQKIASNAVTSEKIADGTIANTDLDKASIPLSGFGAAADDLDLGSNRITHVADPTDEQDAATKHYVDGQVAADGDKDDTNEIQDLSLSSNTLSLSLSTQTIDLSPYLDNTDNQNLASSKSGTQVTVTIDNGTATTFDISDGDNDPTNESLTAAVLDGTDLKITESGNETTVDLSSLKDVYVGGSAIEVTGNSIAAQYDGITIGLNASNELELMAGAVNNDKIADHTIDFIKMASSGAGNGQVMVWSNILNEWVPGNAASISGNTDGDITAVTTPINSGLQGGNESGDVTLSLVNTGEGEILIGNGTNITATTVSGAISLSSSGNTAINSGAVQSNHLSDNAVSTNKIADGAITSEKLAGMSASEGQVMTFKSGKWVAESPVSNSTSITRTSYYAVDPLDFVVLGQAGVSHTSYPITPDEAMYVAVENSNNSASIAAPIHLPHGATIQEVTFYYMDDENGVSESKDIVFEVTRKARRNGPNETMASFTTSDASAIAQEAVVVDITNGTIDNSQYTYRIIANLRGSNSYGASKHRIYSVVIKYSETIQHD